MKKSMSIITVGFCPAWDITCGGREVDWGRHSVIDFCSEQPAGKALNISRALTWLGQKSIVAGLWGRDDYQQMVKAMAELKQFVRIEFTQAAGRTRKNINVIDFSGDREMHLRDVSGLANEKSLKKLKADLQKVVDKNSVCVFAGSLPGGECLDKCIEIIKSCGVAGAKIVVDSSGAGLKKAVDSGSVWLVKPNVEELGELMGRQIEDAPLSLAGAGKKLLEKVEIVLISRGGKGAIVVSKDGVWQGSCAGSRKVLSTVACGDYLLAGFLNGLHGKKDLAVALETGLKVAAARAWGLVEKSAWQETRAKIKVRIGKM